MTEMIFCRIHGGFHYPPGDPDCQFEDGAGNDITIDPDDDEEFVVPEEGKN